MTDNEKTPGRVALFLAVVAAWLAGHRQDVLEVVGVALIVAGIALWSVPVALVVAGVALLVIAHPVPLPRWSR